MNQNILFEISKFRRRAGFGKKSFSAIFFTDRKKVFNAKITALSLPKHSAVIIREYDLKRDEREVFAEEIFKTAQSRNLKIIIGKDFALAKRMKASGVHFSDFDKLPIQILQKKLFPKNFIFSFTCHSLKSLLWAQKMNFDIIFLSPIFPTSSHKQAKTFGLKNLAKIINNRKVKSPICALGGVNLQNLKGLRKLGLSGFGAIDLFVQNS